MKWRRIFIVGPPRTERRVTTTKYTQNPKIKRERALKENKQ